MKSSPDHVRLTDPGSHAAPELSAAIHALRAGRGSAEQIQSLGARLTRELAIPVTAGTQLGLSLWTKWLLGALLSSALGWYAMPRGAVTEARAPDVAHTAVNPAQLPTAPRLNVPPPAIAAPSTVDARPVAEPKTRTVRARVSPLEQPPEPNAEAELLLLQRSQAALDHNARLALSVAESHARDYPRGVFEQEREILAIEALLKLRRKEDAVTRARVFVQDHPESPHTPRVRALLDRSKFEEFPTKEPPRDHSNVQHLWGGVNEHE